MKAVNRRWVLLFSLCLGGLSPVVGHTQEVVASDRQTDSYIVFGGTGGTGLEIVKLLVENGNEVTAFVRPTSDRSRFETLPVSFVVGDALDAASVSRAISSKPFAAVISSLGSPFLSDHRVDSDGNINVIEGSKLAGIERILMVSSIGAGDSRDAIPGVLRTILGGGLDAKTIAEDHMKTSGLDWTIIRPGNLGDGPATGTARLINDPSAFKAGTVPRAEVARLLVSAIKDPATAEKAFNIIQD